MTLCTYKVQKEIILKSYEKLIELRNPAILAIPITAFLDGY